jgi:hypothetical protein
MYLTYSPCLVVNRHNPYIFFENRFVVPGPAERIHFVKRCTASCAESFTYDLMTFSRKLPHVKILDAVSGSDSFKSLYIDLKISSLELNMIFC